MHLWYYVSGDFMFSVILDMDGTLFDSQRIYIPAWEEIGESFGYKGKEFVLENAAANLKKMDFKKLSLSIDALIEADSALKSFSSDSRIIIEQLVIKLVYIVAKGEAID
jgi:beta-phosphoglucomutase-like phosphatase (HAD superfamily)